MDKYIERERYLTECTEAEYRQNIYERRLTREERNRRKHKRLVYMSMVVLLTALIAYILVSTGSEATGDDVSPEETVVTVQTIPEPEVEAAPAEYDPVRDDVPMDAETQRLLYQACGETGIRYELALAVIWQETDFRNVVGDGGESFGYMQVQPQWHGERMERLGVTDLADPYGNFLVGLDFLAELLETHELTDALTRYNSGRTGDSQYARDVLNYMNILTMEEF